MTTLNSQPKVGDLVKHEYDRRYTRENVTLALNTAPGSPSSQLGRVVDADGAEIIATAEANARAVVVSDELVEDGDAVNILRRGPALINRGKIKATDSAGASLTLATVISALEDEGIQVLDELPETSEQTT